MFSWSNAPARRGAPNRIPPQFPGGTTSLPVAQTIQGSIRPPPALTGSSSRSSFTRDQHLESFKADPVLHHSTRKVSQDDTTYDTVFQTKSGDTLILRIYFPLVGDATAIIRAPNMTLVGVKAAHPWLNSRMRVIGYPAIQSDVAWNHSGLLLGQAVHEVVNQLQLYPPTILEITNPGLAALQQKVQVQTTSPHPQAYQPSPPDYDSLPDSITRPNSVEMPFIPTHYPDELDSLTREELQNLLSNESAFLEVIDNLPVHQEMQLLETSIQEENSKKAMSILEREQEYKLLHGQVQDLKESLVLKIAEFETFEVQQSKLCQITEDLAPLKRALNQARKTAMDESEQYAMNWVEDGSNVTEFCKEFCQKRNMMHLRAAKMELLERPQHQQRNGKLY